MIYLYDNKRKKIGVLENSHNTKINETINTVWGMSFEMPINDKKNKLIQPFGYARYTEEGELYRIMPQTFESDDKGHIIYEAEHVLAMLIDKVLFGFHQVGGRGYYTDQVIRYILSKQNDWILDRCDFRRQFEYGFEQESLLSALFSVPKPFSENYIWKWNTKVYPFRISLERLEVNNQNYEVLMKKKNLLDLKKKDNPYEIATRIYPLGYGEGVNQLTIKSVNNGLPYIQSPQHIIDKYGIIERVWIDRRYENAESLKAAGEAMLREMEEQRIEYEVDVSEYKKGVGDTVRIIDKDSNTDTKKIVIGVEREIDDIEKVKLVVANKTTNIAESVADIADRQRIEMSYSQGATQLYAQSLQANADSNDGAELNFYIPSEMRVVNKVLVKVKKEAFRAYSKATQGGGADIISTEDGGAYDATTQDSTGINIELSETQTVSSTTFQGSSSYTTGVNPSVTITTDPLDSPSRSERSSYEVDDWGRELNAPDNYWEPPSPKTTSIERSGSVSNGLIDTGEGGGYNRVLLTAENSPAVGSTSNPDSTNEVWTLSSAYSPGDVMSPEGDPPHVHGLVNHTHPHSHRFELPMHTHHLNLDIPAHTHQVDISQHRHTIEIPGHSHTFDISDHYHDFVIPAHGHRITDKGHSHRFKIDPHPHRVRLEDHEHTITPGIYRFSEAGGFTLYVNNRRIGSFYADTEEIDITNYLLDAKNKIPRGTWHSVKIVPTGLAYIMIDLYMQGFVQSRGDKTV